jgi:hypothetical protein
MLRRKLLLGAACAGLSTGRADAHTPYRQWDVFRQRYLQVLTARTDLEGDALGDRCVALLRQKLPLSQALVSRARDMLRVASLLKTDQARWAILSLADARAMAMGEAPFEDLAPLPLSLLLDAGSHLFVVRPDVPLHHAYLVVASLMEAGAQLNLRLPLQARFGMGLHPGADAVRRGVHIDMPPASS